QKRGEALRSFERAQTYDQKVDALKEAFAKQDGDWVKKFYDAKATKFDPQATEFAEILRATLVEMDETAKSAELLKDAKALSVLTHAAMSEYQRLKDARASVDFDDLIIAAKRLFADPERSAWVMYKLDQGIEHVLLDEAQDTSPGAWDVIEATMSELLAGLGTDQQSALRRTFFAVGDRKQSIYAFQGADADLFQEKLVDLGKQLSAVTQFENVALQLSFRTTPPILRFVDTVFAERSVREGLTDDIELRHNAMRSEEPGLVELWPLTPAIVEEDIDKWDVPLDAIGSQSRERRLATAIALKIEDLLAHAYIPDTSKGKRRVSPSDIMILVRSRGAVFTETIRALTAKEIPTAGADKLQLLDDQGVLDMMSFARSVLSDADALSLAETLKSPFFGISEEDLFSLAHGREGSLHDAFRNACASNQLPAIWWQRFEAARKTARQSGPFEFFSFILDSGELSTAADGMPFLDTGRSRLNAQLGAPSREPVEALLSQAIEFERSQPNSLRGFIDWILRRGAVVNRETDQLEDVVRVTTVHKSKGLEAPIVFVLETHKKPILDAEFVDLAGSAGTRLERTAPAMVAVPPKMERPGAVEEAKNRANSLTYNEDRRLLYVALTRARDMLFLCGIEPKRRTTADKDHAEYTWDEHARAAFDALLGDSSPPSASVVDIENALWERSVLRYASKEYAANGYMSVDAAESSTPAPRETNAPIPNCLLTPPRPEAPPRRLSPTKLADALEYEKGA
ncbi:MAG: 3'-5' exonuclease, partial [Pseudomonadota bacterium]